MYDRFRQFADACVESVAQAISNCDYEAYCQHFDMALVGEDFPEDDFLSDIATENEGLGRMKSHQYFGQVKGNQEGLPGNTRFVYGGVFDKGEAVIMLCVHEREAYVE